MPQIGTGGDLLASFDLSAWIVGCHSSWDLLTTITGDLALTKDTAENNRQRLLMWMVLPRGERLDPSIGCCLYDYLHAKMTDILGKQLELDLKADLSQVFPDLKIKQLSVNQIKDLTGGNREIQMSMYLGDDKLQFAANWGDISKVNDQINAMVVSGIDRVESG